MTMSSFAVKFLPANNVVTVIGATSVLQLILSSFEGSRILRAVRAVLERTSCSWGEAGFAYPNLEFLDWDEVTDGPIWEGVELRIMHESEHVPEPTFARLMLRVAHTFIAGANEHDHPMLREPWWPELLDATKRLETMVAALPPDEPAP